MGQLNYSKLERELIRNNGNMVRTATTFAQETKNHYSVQPTNYNPEVDATGDEILIAVNKYDRAKAWDALEEKLEIHGIPARIAKENAHIKDGEDIILYVDKNHQRDWKAILDDVEQRLHDAGVQPGKKADVAVPFEGSAYMTRRNHTMHNGKPAPEAERAAHPYPYRDDFMRGVEVKKPRHPAYARLNKMTTTLNTHMGIKGQWEQNLPSEEKRVEGARLIVESAEQADQIAQILAEQDISANAGHYDEEIDEKKSTTHLVEIPANEFSIVSEEAVLKADTKIQAQSFEQAFQNHESRGFSGLPWSVEENPKRGDYMMMVRIDDPEKASSLSQFVSKKTGLVTGVQSTTVMGKKANYVVAQMERPQELDVFNEAPQQQRIREFLNPDLAHEREAREQQAATREMA